VGRKFSKGQTASPATTNGEKVMPRVVALLDVMQIFDGSVPSMMGRK
jgi:hypothetical protein